MDALTARKDKDIEKRATIFRIVLNKISFQYDGLYSLKLTISGSNVLSKRGLRMRVGSNKSFLNDYSIKTEVIGPVKKGSDYEFELKEYAFYLPKGYCKNDVTHEVYLLIEAQQIDNNAQSKTIGSVKLSIYPRSDVVANYDRVIGEPFYEIEETIRIIKLDKNSSELHCGDLRYSAEFSEIHEIIESEPLPKEEPVALVKRPLVEISGVTPAIEDELRSRNEKETNTTKMGRSLVEIGSQFGQEQENSPIKTIDEPDNGEKMPPSRDIHITGESYRTLAEPGCEEISILVHGARNVYNRNGALTRCYVVCLQRTAAPISHTQFDSTHTTKFATAHPYWGEIVTIGNEAGKLHKFINILLIDSTADNILTEFLLPASNLQPFFQHHLTLSQEMRGRRFAPQNQIDLSITVIRKLDHFVPKQSSMEFSAIIVKPLCLRYSTLQFNSANSRLICLSYITNDVKKKNATRPNISELFDHVQLPLNTNHEYNTSHLSGYSSGQLTVHSSFVEHDKPQDNGTRLVNETYWNFPLVFNQSSEIDTAFSVNSAIVVELYITENIKSSISSPWKFIPTNTNIVIPLNQMLFEQLNAPAHWKPSATQPSNENAALNQYKVNFPQNSTNFSNNQKADKMSVCVKLVADGKMDYLSPEDDLEQSNLSRNSDKVLKSTSSSDFLYEIKPGITTNTSRPYINMKKSQNHPPNQSNKRIPQSRNSMITTTNSKAVSGEDKELSDRLGRMEREMQQIRHQAQILERQRHSYARGSVGNSDVTTENRKIKKPQSRSTAAAAEQRISTPEYLQSLENAVKEKERWIRHLEKKLKR